MLITWLVQGRPRYASMEANQQIAYISDVGAGQLKPLFTTIAVLMTVALDIAFLSERWLRHKRRLTPNATTAEKVLSGLSILFALVGTVGLIGLSGPFDTLRHPRLHDLFLLLFMGGYLISAIMICAEYQRLGRHYRQHRILRLGFWIKLAFVVVELVLAIAFGSLLFKGDKNVGAVLEWCLAFFFTFYILTFLIDLLPAVHTKGDHHPDESMRRAIDENGGQDQFGQSAASSNEYDGGRLGTGPVAHENFGNGSANGSYDRAGKQEMRHV